MASAERMVLSLEEDYERLRNKFEEKIDEKDREHRVKELQKNEIVDLLRATMSFQRKIEYILQQVEKLLGIHIKPDESVPVVHGVTLQEYATISGLRIEDVEKSASD